MSNKTLFYIFIVSAIFLIYVTVALVVSYETTFDGYYNSDKISQIVTFSEKILDNPINIFNYIKNHHDKKGLYKKISNLYFMLVAGLFIYLATKIKGEFWNKEKGSAKWGDESYRKKKQLNLPYLKFDEKAQIKYGFREEIVKNLILSNTEYLPINMKKIYRNINILVIGASGAGKTRWFVKPNIAQANMNLIITDPKGELHNTTSKLLEDQGYTIKVLNLVDPEHSNTYNPIKYIAKEMDIDTLVDTIIKNTEDKKKGGGDGFWLKAETALFKALLHYVYKEYPEENKNLYSILHLLISSKEDDEGESVLTIMFKQLEEKKPNHVALRYYNIFLQAPKEVRRSILISLSVRLAFIGSDDMINLTSTDNIDLDDVERKVAIYVIISDTTSAYNVIASVFFTQAFQRLYYLADKKYKGELPIHFEILLDEFANIGQIPDYQKVLSTMRGRRIGSIPIVQTTAQLEQLYEKDADTIIGNSDVILVLGTTDLKLAETISKRLGKKTILVEQKSYTKGKNSSQTINYQKQARELMTPDEILGMDDDKCIVMIRGFRPFLSKKYNLERHPYFNFFDNKENFFPTEKRFAEYNPDEDIMSDYIAGNEIDEMSELELEAQNLINET